MNILQRIFGVGKKKAMSVRPDVAFRFIGGQLVMYKDNKTQYIEKGYTYNDIIYSIIRLILDKAKVAPWGVYQIKDEKAYGQLLAVRKEPHLPGRYKMAKDLSVKAIEPYSGDGKLTELLRYPNETQTLSDLHESLWGFKLVTGDYYEYWQTADDGLNRGKPLSLSSLPADKMEIFGSKTFPQIEESYQLQLGAILPFTRDEILHEKYWNPEWDLYGEQLYGMSPLRAALRRIQRNNEAQVAGLSAFQNGGARGLLTPENNESVVSSLSEMTWEQLGAIKERVDMEIGGGAKMANKTSLLNMPFKWQSIGLSPVDLAILESEQFDLRMLCNVFGVPSQLMNDPENKSYNNQSEGEKALTARCAMPLLNSRRDSFNRKLQSLPAYKGKNIIVDYDMTVYTELEEDKKEQAEWLNTAWWLTGNQKLAMMGEPESDNPLMNEVILPNSLSLLRDLDMQAPDMTGDVEQLDKSGLNPYQ